MKRINLVTRVLPLAMGLLGTLVKAFLGLGSAMYPGTTYVVPSSKVTSDKTKIFHRLDFLVKRRFGDESLRPKVKAYSLGTIDRGSPYLLAPSITRSLT